MTKVVNTPGGAVAGRSVTLCSRLADRSTIVVEERGDGVDAVVLKWIRSRAAKQEEEPQGHHCIGCRTAIAGSTDDELRAAGGVFLAGGGWFCGPRCERQYRLRFRIQPAGRTPTPTPAPAPAEKQEEPSSGRRSAADELAEALRARRRQLTNGV
jgi:hypothetical protein